MLRASVKMSRVIRWTLKAMVMTLQEREHIHDQQISHMMEAINELLLRGGMQPRPPGSLPCLSARSTGEPHHESGGRGNKRGGKS